MSAARFPEARLLAACAILLATPALALEADCVTEPSRTVEVRAAVEGLIAAIPVDRGDTVKSGQVLVQLEAGREQASADLAQFRATMQGALRSAESRLAYAELKASRSAQMHEERFVSAENRDEAQTEKKLAEAQLLEVQDNQRVAELENRRAQAELRLRTVRSPINGVVVERSMNPGELADNRDARRPILKLANVGVLHVEALLPLDAHRQVRKGQSAIVIPENPIGGRHPATVKVVDPVIDAASGTFGVRLELPNPGQAIPAGVKCRVVFQ
jgi:RND family efflux transporter MFP subunit